MTVIFGLSLVMLLNAFNGIFALEWLLLVGYNIVLLCLFFLNTNVHELARFIWNVIRTIVMVICVKTVKYQQYGDINIANLLRVSNIIATFVVAKKEKRYGGAGSTV